MKVLMLNGSPRPHQCTFMALSEVAKTLGEAGIESEIVHVGASAARGCIACGKCAKLESRCGAFDDIVNELIEKMASCDGLVIGSPVYYASANGTLTALLDRMFFAGKGVFAFKPGASVVSARRAGTTAALDQLNKYITISNMPLVSSCYWAMVHGHTAEQARQDEEGMRVMRTLGRNMAWLLKCIETGKSAGISPAPKEEGPATNFIR